uniref:Uncharacterized protein n=1 Tax=Oryza rufipogon TaxID=4529 RepID=A0A0E0PWA6_ORYRU
MTDRVAQREQIWRVAPMSNAEYAKHIPPSSPRPGVALLLVAVAGRRRSRVARNPESLPAAYSPRASASSSISGAPPSCRSADPPSVLKPALDT